MTGNAINDDGVIVVNGVIDNRVRRFLLRPVTLDRDGDRMPDVWEIEKFGNIDMDPNDNNDGDGYTNIQEFENGTNPNSYKLVLCEGWNLVAVGRLPTDNSIQSIFGDNIMGNVWRWHDGQLEKADKFLPLTGYWVYAAMKVEIEIALP